jgi:hypothetical protein
MRSRTAVVVPPSRYEVILMSSRLRCRLRGRHLRDEDLPLLSLLAPV